MDELKYIRETQTVIQKKLQEFSYLKDTADIGVNAKVNELIIEAEKKIIQVQKKRIADIELMKRRNLLTILYLTIYNQIISTFACKRRVRKIFQDFPFS